MSLTANETVLATNELATTVLAGPGFARMALARTMLLALCSAATVALVAQADARPRHRQAAQPYMTQPVELSAGNDGKSYYSGPALQPGVQSDTAARSARRASRHARSVADNDGSIGAPVTAGATFGSSALVSTARNYIGTNPTGRRTLWCGAFMDLVLRKNGHAGGGNLARAYARYGTRVSGPQVGAIAVMGRKGGGHVGVVSGIDANGNPIIISGNHNRTVAESVYPRGRITAYVVPN